MELRNHQTHPIRLFIEPWCAEYFLVPGAEVTLESTGHEMGDRPYFGLDFSAYQIIVWAEGGINDVHVSQNGELLEIGQNAEAWRLFCREEGIDPGSASKSEPGVRP